jgi:peptidyl-prolyl cis-trans isomerase SurA
VSRRSGTFFLLGALLAAGPPARPAAGQQPQPGQRISIDGIAAVVGNQIVLRSEVELALNQAAYERGLNPENLTPQQREQLRTQVLDELINNALILAKARRDSVTVTRSEVDRQVDNQITTVRERFGGEEGFQQALQAEGLSAVEFRRRLAGQAENYLLSQKLMQQANILRPTTVSRRDGAAWLRTNRDHLMVLRDIRLTPPEQEGDPDVAARARISDLRRRIVEGGEDFADLARRFSQDPGSTPEGGDLGTVPKGTYVQAVEAAAWSLPVGEVSEPIRSTFGWHLIQVLERTADQVHVRHILIRPSTGGNALQALADTIAAIRTALESGSDFIELVARWSDEPDAVASRGLFAIMPLPISPTASGLPPAWVQALQTMERGAWAGPLELTDAQGGNSIHFVQRVALDEEVIGQLLQHRFAQVESQVQNERRQAAVQAWFEELRHQTYVEIKKLSEH